MAIDVVSLACWVFGASLCGPPPDPLIAISGPRDLIAFELRDGTGATLWAISAAPPRTPESIYYGIVPEGFVQHTPAAGTPPRGLVYGEPVTTSTRTLKYLFKHRGIASSENGFVVEGHSMEVVAPTSRER